VAQPDHASTDEELAAGAVAPEAAHASSNVAETMVPDVAATMTADSTAARDSTTLMPVWSPPAPPPSASDLPDTMASGGLAQTASTAVPGGGAQAELTIESGPDAGHTHRAGDSALRLGRSPDNDVILRDPATSGHHARLERRGDQFWIVDLGSTNGTLVNGDPIQEKQLSHGDRVTIGQNAVHFSVLGA
jgi:FHA domain